MTSQSVSPGEEGLDEYREAWASMALLVERGQMSWSGRESNRVFLNLGAAGFADVSGLTAAAFLEDGRACARLDWDEDGRQDLLLRSRNAPKMRLLLNRWPQPGNWLQLDLVGAGSSRDAIGATVIVEAGGARSRSTVRAGEGFLAASSKRLHFGLGAAAQAERALVRWPNGKEESFRALPANGRYRLVQGTGRAESVPQQPLAKLLAADPEPAAAAADRTVTRVPLVSRLPLAALPIPGWESPARTAAEFAGSPMLINFFSTTCAACVEELGLLREQHAVLSRSALQVVPMLVESGADPAAARAMLAQYGFDERGGVATETLKAAVEFIFADVLLYSDEVPLPCSLLLDRQGQLSSLYVGKIRIRDLTTDLGLISRLPLDELVSSRPLGGRLLAPRVREFSTLAGQFRGIGLHELAKSCDERAAAVLAQYGEPAASARR